MILKMKKQDKKQENNIHPFKIGKKNLKTF